MCLGAACSLLGLGRLALGAAAVLRFVCSKLWFVLFVFLLVRYFGSFFEFGLFELWFVFCFVCLLLWFVLRVAFVPFRLCEALAYFVFVLFVRYFGSFFAFRLIVTLIRLCCFCFSPHGLVLGASFVYFVCSLL